MRLPDYKKTLIWKNVFIQGFLSNVLNPKVAQFFVAFLPQFVSEESLNHSFNMIGLGLIFALMTIIFLMILGLFAGSIGSWLKEKKRIAGKIRIGSGTVLMLLGLRLIVPQNNWLSINVMKIDFESWCLFKTIHAHLGTEDFSYHSSIPAAEPQAKKFGYKSSYNG